MSNNRAHTREEHITMINTPEAWPLVTILPVVRGDEYGCISRLDLLEVIYINAYDVLHIARQWDDEKRLIEYLRSSTNVIRYTTTEELVADGWEVD